MIKLIRFLVLAGLFPAFLFSAGLPPDLQDGFVVWESNRTGSWRIFHKEISGGTARQLSPDEEGRDHLAPHLCPEGRRLVYLSYPRGRHGYRIEPPDVVIPMMILDLERPDDPPRVLLPNARPYGEHRAAVWLDAYQLIWINPDLFTYLLDLRSGESTRLLDDRPPRRRWDHAYLLDRTLQFAYSGVPGFFPADVRSRTVQAGGQLSGCQPLMTDDSVWGVWMGGMGGPISRQNLRSGEISHIMLKNDPRMPASRNYLYFPFVSPCQQILGFAASPNQHDHHRSNYDIFLAPIDPSTLDLTGPSVHFVKHPGNDRYPVVFLRDLALGRHEGEAPYRVTFPHEPGVLWHLDGKPVTSPGLFLFDTPGRHTIEREQDGKMDRGLVVVHPAAPPRLVSHRLIGDNTVLLRFDEPVNADNLRVFFEGRRRSVPANVDVEDSRVTLAFATPLDLPLELHLEGVEDLAQRPNLAPRISIALDHPRWPVHTDGLVLVWEHAEGTRLLRNPETGEEREWVIASRGRGRLDAGQAMVLDGGAFVAETGAEELRNAVQNANAFTLEALVQSRRAPQNGPARIVSFSRDSGNRNFTLGQERDRFVLRLRTTRNAPNAVNPQLDLGPVDLERPVHLAFTYEPGVLTVYRDGEKFAAHATLQGNLSNWEPMALLFGDELDGNRDWAGTVEGVALYNRVLSGEEVADHARESLARIHSRPEVPAVQVRARLVEASRVPSLEEISPYRSLLVRHEFERVGEGGVPERFRVLFWAWMDGQSQTNANPKPGETVSLRLEPFSAHPHLQDLSVADSLNVDLDQESFLEVSY